MSTTGVKVVIDTNTFITTLCTKSPNRWIFDKIRTGEFELCVSNEILWEYEEILTQKTNETVARNVIDFLLISPFVHFIDVFFNWQLIRADPDDNKFVDCGIAANAGYIVSEDQDFRVLENIDFPKVRICSIEEFRGEIIE